MLRARLFVVVWFVALNVLSAVDEARLVPSERVPGLDCPLVVRVAIESPEDLRALTSWTEPWEVHPGEVVVGLRFADLERLRAEGFSFSIDRDRSAELCQPLRKALPGQGIPGYECYSLVEDTYARAMALVAQQPRLAQWIDIGDSWAKSENPQQGYDLMVLKLANRDTEGTPTSADPAHKPRIFVMASMHAREYAPAELLTRFAEELVAGYGTDADATWILDEHELFLLLQANPDGRKEAETGLLWRKNVNNEFCSGTNERGVDLNRNYEYQWDCCGGSSPVECDLTFHGSGPASEPETEAVQDYLRQIFPDQGAPNPSQDATGVFIDLHSYGRLVLWPWGHTVSVPTRGTQLQTLGRKLAFFNGHDPRQAIGFYPVDGSTIDFAFGDRGVASFLYEVGAAFFERCDSFERGVLEGNLASLRYAAKMARTPYRTPAGPDVSMIELGPSAVVPAGAIVTITARADDRRFQPTAPPERSQSITRVEIWTNSPPWRDRAEADAVIRMRPVDGVLDSVEEEVAAELSTGSLGEGRHTLYLRARDADGNWGAVSAEFLWVGEYPPEGRRRSAGRLGG